jgi:hypothetical protein
MPPRCQSGGGRRTQDLTRLSALFHPIGLSALAGVMLLARIPKVACVWTLPSLTLLAPSMTDLHKAEAHS